MTLRDPGVGSWPIGHLADRHRAAIEHRLSRLERKVEQQAHDTLV